MLPAPRQAGGARRFLPASSPDPPPSAPAFSAFTARTREAWAAAIGAALDEITAADARACFAHCGAAAPAPPPAEQPLWPVR